MTRIPRSILVAIGTAVAIGAAFLFCTSRYPGRSIVANPADFRAFYCAGEAIGTRQDPYHADPLRACEVRETLAAGLSPYRKLAIPTPLPGYALLPFVVFARLSFAQASTLYTILQIVAIGATALLLAKRTRTSLLAISCSFILNGTIAILNGQPFPFAVLALCAAAFALRDGAYRSVGLYIAIAAIEPHLALPPIIALAWAEPRTRIPLSIALAALTALCLVALDPATNLEYVTQIIAAHARSEATSGNQYSLTTILVHSGVSIQHALAMADAQYAIFAAVGIVVARSIARRYQAPEAIVLIPPVFVLFGGPFVHITQIALAVPALIALIARIPESRTSLGVALVTLTIPWPDISDLPELAGVMAIAIVALPMAIELWRPKFLVVALTLAALVGLDFGLHDYRAHHRVAPSDPASAIANASKRERLAEATWFAYIDSKESPGAGATLAVRAPTWIALFMAIVTLLVLALRSRAPGAKRLEHFAHP